MKKRKTYEISVIDKTYSNTISDETKFYTSDTALELCFELKETEYTFESAEIVLLNIDDRSLVTRTVVKSLGSFAYELDDDITAHYGEWRGQLRFEQSGEVYVSSPIKFRIENDLSNERPLQLSDVQSWVSLKRYADGLVDELKQAVLEVEGIDGTFNVNELERQDKFETAEQSRQTTFATNESERDETFNANETTRQAQELEREKAETQRQTIFDNNEVNRTETFNTNEATRRENETARQQAETQRATAESSRESAEAQRKIDHANRSAELAGKADKIVINNVIENGDFSINEISSNFIISTSLQESATINDGKLVLKPKTFTWNNYIRIDFTQNIGDKIYCRFTIDSPISTQVDWRVGGVSNPISYVPGESTISFVKTVRSISNFMYLYTQDFTPTMLIKLDNVEAINLTQTFGAGNEPTKEEMDELIKVTGYIDGEYALNNKEMLTWTLALIRRNKNAIITLGGTI